MVRVEPPASIFCLRPVQSFLVVQMVPILFKDLLYCFSACFQVGKTSINLLLVH
jgi:hypothetical protein